MKVQIILLHFVKHLMDTTDETTWIMNDMLFDAINLTLNINNGEIIRSVIICDKSFPTKRNLLLHVIQTHPKTIKLISYICEEDF